MPALVRIDELLRGDHWYLEPSDECYFFMEYTARKDFNHSVGNQFIANFKKPMAYKDTPGWYYKKREIRSASQMLGANLPGIVDLGKCTLVPIPPSKQKTNPEYDDRTLLTVKGIGNGTDVQELISFKEEMEPAHRSAKRKNVAELKDIITVEAGLNVNQDIVLFDDVITTGCHFKACQESILEQYPTVNIIGVFLARRVPEDPFAGFQIDTSDDE